jgi:hypothetical protein
MLHWLKALAIGAVAVIAAIGAAGCLEDPAAAEEAVSGKPQTQLASQMRQVKMGVSESEVVAILGKPNDAQTMDAAGSHSECWYYGDVGEWQVCFDDIMGPYGVSSKNHY